MSEQEKEAAVRLETMPELMGRISAKDRELEHARARIEAMTAELKLLLYKPANEAMPLLTTLFGIPLENFSKFLSVIHEQDPKGPFEVFASMQKAQEESVFYRLKAEKLEKQNHENLEALAEKQAEIERTRNEWAEVVDNQNGEIHAAQAELAKAKEELDKYRGIA